MGNECSFDTSRYAVWRILHNAFDRLSEAEAGPILLEAACLVGLHPPCGGQLRLLLQLKRSVDDPECLLMLYHPRVDLFLFAMPKQLSLLDVFPLVRQALRSQFPGRGL